MRQAEGVRLLIAVGERCHLPEVTRARVASWRELWERNPGGMAWTAEAMTPGSQVRTRLERHYGIAEHLERCVNLLPPDREIGTWDGALARRAAQGVLTRARRDGARLVLLGRRVIAAFDLGDAPFGAVRSLEGVRVLCAPHPSGRNRLLNDPGRREEVRAWAAVFLSEGTSCGRSTPTPFSSGAMSRRRRASSGTT